MKFEEILAMDFPGGLFRSGQLMAGETSPAGVRRQLDRWIKSGRVIQLRRGVYLLNRPLSGIRAHPFAIANHLSTPSYVSLQSALAFYGIIPEYVPVTTSITTGRTELLDTPVGRFQFRHVKKNLFSGFLEREVSRDQKVLIATAGKAIVDLLYLTPDSDNPDYLEELRFSFPDNFSWEGLEAEAKKSDSKKVSRAVYKLMEIFGREPS
jgi:hypothetical protein